MQKSVLFILSTNFAGSHFLSLMLGSHSRAEHIGEVHHLRQNPLKRQPCHLCGDYKKCPFLQGIEPGKVERLHETIFRNVAPEISLLVDASKQVEWARRFLNNNAFEKKFIHLIRDPRALVRRWDVDIDTPKKRWNQRWKIIRQRPGRALNSLLAPQRMLYRDKWVTQNRRFTEFLTNNHLDHTVVTYHDLATNTSTEMKRLMTWLGLEFEPSQIEYWNFEHHGTQKTEYRSGKAGYFDTRWKDYLTPAEQQKIRSYTPIEHYLHEIDLTMTEAGLVRPHHPNGCPQQAESARAKNDFAI